MSTASWETLLEAHPFTETTLAETLIGGQAFRWFWEPVHGAWIGTWARHVVRLRLGKTGVLEVQRLTTTSLEEIRAYLAIDRLESLIATLPCNADPVLARLHQRWKGLSLLRQPASETLLAFICSSNKQILQIRTMLHNMSQRFGEPIEGTPFKTLPSWEVLAAVTEAELRTCALGYRARHVAGSAAFLKARPDFLNSIEGLSLSEARTTLRELPGVGPKVADCILLFGFGRMETFPVDTWIAKLMGQHYPELANWSREQIATFARIHYGQAAGLAQQWLFSDRSAQAEIQWDKWLLQA